MFSQCLILFIVTLVTLGAWDDLRDFLRKGDWMMVAFMALYVLMPFYLAYVMFIM